MCYVVLVIVSVVNQTGTFLVTDSYIEKKPVASSKNAVRGENVILRLCIPQIRNLLLNPKP